VSCFRARLRKAILHAATDQDALPAWLAEQIHAVGSRQRQDALFLIAEISSDKSRFVYLAIENLLAQSELELTMLDDLVAIGRHHRFVRLFVIDLAKPGPPLLRTDHHHAMDFTWDAPMHYRSYTVASLRHLGDYFVEFKQVILAALDTFEECDPDWCYDGSHGRISDLIESFDEVTGQPMDADLDPVGAVIATILAGQAASPHTQNNATGLNRPSFS